MQTYKIVGVSLWTVLFFYSIDDDSRANEGWKNVHDAGAYCSDPKVGVLLIRKVDADPRVMKF